MRRILLIVGLSLAAIPSTYATTQAEIDEITIEYKSLGDEIHVANNEMTTAWQQVMHGQRDVDLASSIARYRRAIEQVRTYQKHYLLVFGNAAADQSLTNQWLATEETKLNELEQIAKAQGWIK